MNKSITLLLAFILLFFFSTTSLFADTCTAISSGDWDDGSIWSCGHKPTGGDDVIIPPGIIVTVTSSDDLSGLAPISMRIADGGFLVFEPACDNGTCKIDFKLADGSGIDVDGANGISVNPPNWAVWVKLWIGNDLVLHGSSGSNSFPFGPGTLGLGSLPVELASFRGSVMDRYNMLEWQTESEENAMVFLIERSLDGYRDFTEIGRIGAYGNSSILRSYELKDESPVSLAYYRLRIVDFDGTFEYSDVIVVERSKTDIDLVEVYPVPAEEEVTVLVHTKSAGKAILTISDFLGRKIKQEKIELKAGINHYVFDFGEHETNFYYLTIYNGKEKIAKKILRASRD